MKVQPKWHIPVINLDIRKHCYDMVCSVQFSFIDFYQIGTCRVKPTAHWDIYSLEKYSTL